MKIKKNKKVSKGIALKQLVNNLFDSIDADKIELKALEIAKKPIGSDPGENKRKEAQKILINEASNQFNGELIDLLDSIRRDKEQRVDHDNFDEVIYQGWIKI